jgi:hypothetical protein
MNVAKLYPAMVKSLYARLLVDGVAYIDGTMYPQLLQRGYYKVMEPGDHGTRKYWKNFLGPCYLQKER